VNELSCQSGTDEHVLTSDTISHDTPDIELSELIPFYVSDKNCLKFAHINVNSIRNKFGPLAEIMQKGIIDVMSIQESKLDMSFPLQQFYCNGFKMYRKDHAANAGGIILYIRNDLVQRRREDLEFDVDNEFGRLESICVETYVHSEKWLICSTYKQPKMKDSKLYELFENVFDTYTNESKIVIIMGDININLFNKPNDFSNLMAIYGCKNIITQPTCFKGKTPSLIDLVMTNVPKRIKTSRSIDVGLSDCHNMVYFSTKQHVPKRGKRYVMYRSYKNFNVENYNADLQKIPFHVGEIFDDFNDMYYFSQQLISEVMDEHAPVKHRVVKHNSLPYMNGDLRKLINVKNMLKRKYDKCSTKENWNAYRKSRNATVLLRKNSIKIYLQKHCNSSGNNGSKDFWKNVKPLISNKYRGEDNITLMEKGDIVSNTQNVCDIMNHYFVNMAKDIGNQDSSQAILCEDNIDDILVEYEKHDSITFIKDNQLDNGLNFDFQGIKTEIMHEELLMINVKKSSGFDNMPPKLLKYGAHSLSHQLTFLVNKSIETCVFPDAAKKADITPIFKKNNNLDKSNYRPVSILSSLSKIFERMLVNQLSSYFEEIFQNDMSGFRNKHCCQSVLLKFLDDVKSNLDNNKIVCTMLTDLSRAFDCLPHRLLIAKMHAYGVSKDACTLVMKYFCNRQQRVKIGDERSEWLSIYKGAPQGSQFGPFAHNVFSNDLLFIMEKYGKIYNYADDNTISCMGDNLNDVKCDMVKALNVMMNWFEKNGMKANPDKFQLIFFDKQGLYSDEHIMVNNIRIQHQSTIKLLGVYIESTLSFKKHVSEICRKAGYKLNVLARLSKTLGIEGKLLLFHSFILSYFNYCSVVWHFCDTTTTKYVEKIQKRALRFIYNDFKSTYGVLRQKSGISLVYIQRLRAILFEVHKSVNKIGPVYMHNLFKVKPVHYEMRKKICVELPKYNSVKYGYETMRYQGANLWNGLNDDVKLLDNQMFKKYISIWTPPLCSCSSCILCKLHHM
jgi:exonuclease III